ncbi:MAG: BNR-4 repeat-containing protein [Verrucomicrobiota bacterium]
MLNHRLIPKRFGPALLVLAVWCQAVTGVAQTNFATLISDGAYTWYNDSRALFHNGQLYFGYVRAGDSKTTLSVFNLQSGQTTNLWASAFTQLDDHNNPGLLSKSDGTLLAIFSRHISDQYFAYRRSITTNPASPAAWNAEQTIPNSGAGMTYANPFQLSAESGKVYNFCRNVNFNPTIYTSTDGGNTWSVPQIFIQTGSGSIRPYVKYASDNTNRVDFLYTDGHPRDVANSLYHLYYQGGAFYKTDGTLVKNYASLPLLHDSGERGSVIYQYSDADTSDPNDHIPTGRAWCWETAYQSNGAPVCVFTVQRDKITGPTQGADDRIYYYYARWTGSAWQKRFIAQAGRPLYSAENDYAGGICLDPQNPNIIYISSNAGDPFNLSDTTNVTLRANQRYEIWRGITADGGLTFSWQQITTNSPLDNLRPYVPRRDGGEPALIWIRGTYSSYTSYACSIVGLFTTPVPQTNAASGIWTADADGFWSEGANWTGGVVADGAGNTADFSALDITADRTVTLDSSRSIGALRFGDLNGGQSWTVNSSGVALLLTNATGLSPGIAVNTNSATLQLTLLGTNGFTKSGVGTLILAGSNLLSGPVNLDRGVDGNNNDGITRLAHPGAVAGASSVSIRNTSVTTAGGSILQLDGTNGDIILPQTLSLTCRNNFQPTVQNLAGTNTLSGTNFIQVGGTNVVYQSDAGSLLRITASILYVGSLSAARMINFGGGGDIRVSGAVLRSANPAPIGVTKSGGGTLTFAGANTYTNGTFVTGGTLLYHGSVAQGRVTVSGGTLGGTGVVGTAVTILPAGTLSPGENGSGILTINSFLTNTGTVFFQLRKSGSTLTNTFLKGISTFSAGGVLRVTNLGPGILTVGDSFKLFQATSAVGGFSSISPATPGPGLVWNTNALMAAGTLSVALGNVRPVIASVRLADTNLMFDGNGGAAGYGFTVLSATNAVLPLAQWSPAGSGACDATGAFAFTNSVADGSLQRFYLLRIP